MMNAAPVVATPAGKTAPALLGGFSRVLTSPGGGDSMRYRGGIIGMMIGVAMVRKTSSLYVARRSAPRGYIVVVEEKSKSGVVK
jgi:hypothetical protein